MQADKEEEEVRHSVDRTSFLRSNSFISKFFRLNEQPKVYKWVIVSDPSSRFTDYTNPFFVHREKTLMAFLAGPGAGRRYETIARNMFTVFPIGLAAECIGPYGITEFLPDEVTFVLIFTAMLRIFFLFRLNTDLLQILYKKYEFIVLVLSCLIGAIGLMDAFNYDRRCALAFNFFTLGVYSACEDATNKYSKKGLVLRFYVVGTFVIYINLSIVLLLIYFGYVPNLVNRSFFVATFPASVEAIDANVTVSSVSGFTVGSLNITLGLVQATLLYLLKSPYRLNWNQLAVLHVSLYAKRVDVEELESQQEEQLETGARIRQVLSSGSDSGEEAFDDEEGSESRTNSKGSKTNKILEITGIDPNKRLYRIAPVRNEYVVAGQPFQWDKKDTIGSRLVGPQFAELCYRSFYHSPVTKGLLALFVAVYPVLLLLALMGIIPKETAWLSVLSFLITLLYCCTLNYDLVRRLFRTPIVRVLLLLMVIGNAGLCVGFKFDVRALAVVLLSVTLFVFVALNDARIRTKTFSKFGAILLTYMYFTYGASLVSFYMNLIVDVEDVIIDPTILSGRNATLELTVVGYSLYCIEIVFLFLARNYYSVTFKGGFSVLELRLRYFVQDMTEAINSPFVESGRVSTFVDPRKISTLIPNTKARPKGIRLPT